MTLVLEKSKKVFTKPRRLLIAKESEASRVQTQTCGSSRYRLPLRSRSRRCLELVRVQQRNQIPVSDRRRVLSFHVGSTLERQKDLICYRGIPRHTEWPETTQGHPYRQGIIILQSVPSKVYARAGHQYILRLERDKRQFCRE